MRLGALPVVLALHGCAAEPPPPPRVVVLVSMDTTRADALSCYAEETHWGLRFPPDARPLPRTPVIDGLAADGVRFSWAIAHAPTTLSSHTSVFSGRDSHRHGVPRNGYPVPADLPLLPERLQQDGWDTIAVVGSSALEKKMGLDRGFVVYDDPGPQPAGGMYMRSATEVTDRALAALDTRAADGERKDDDLFLFVHYYDPHMPWFTAPDEVVNRFSWPGYDGPVDGSMESIGFLTRSRVEGTLRYGDARQARALYLAQVAYVDGEVGRLLQGLERRGLGSDSLVIVTADHGEVLDEDDKRPYTHGPSTALEATHVPLVLRGRGSLALPAGVDVPTMVRSQDIATTVLQRIGLPEVMGDGLDLSPLWSGGGLDVPPAFSEATRPMNLEQKHKWNNANLERSVFDDGLQLRVRPMEGGLATLHRVAPGSPRVADVPRIKSLAALTKRWDAAAPAWVPPSYDDETRQALEALGYLDRTGAMQGNRSTVTPATAEPVASPR